MSTPDSDDLDRLVDILRAVAVGRQHAKTARQLRAFGFPSDRHLRALVHRATDRGDLICADNAGYFVPASADEAQETIGRLRSQAIHMHCRASRLQALVDQVFAPNLWQESHQ